MHALPPCTVKMPYCARSYIGSTTAPRKRCVNGALMRLVSDDTWGILTLLQEASGEPMAGKVAVAEEILNRTKQRFFSHGTVASTVLWPWQYSGWNTKDPNRLRTAVLDDADPEVRSCIEAWTRARTGPPSLPGVTHHYNPTIVPTPPDWVHEMTLLAEIGHHRFYKKREG